MPGPYTYYNTIPDANNDPAVDQPQMLENFKSIPLLIDVDHVDFSQLTAGQHKQVTFPTVQGDPGATGDPLKGILLTENVSGLAQLFFRNNNVNEQLTGLWSYTTNGTNYGFKLPNGLIINFGESAKVPSGGSVQTTYAIPYTSSVYCIVATSFEQNGRSNISASPASAPNEKTKFDLYCTTTSSSSNNPAFYIAIGI